MFFLTELLRQTFRPSFDLGWPRGVQEEDPPPWRWALPPVNSDASRADPTVSGSIPRALASAADTPTQAIEDLEGRPEHVALVRVRSASVIRCG